MKHASLFPSYPPKRQRDWSELTAQHLSIVGCLSCFVTLVPNSRCRRELVIHHNRLTPLSNNLLSDTCLRDWTCTFQKRNVRHTVTVMDLTSIRKWKYLCMCTCGALEYCEYWNTMQQRMKPNRFHPRHNESSYKYVSLNPQYPSSPTFTNSWWNVFCNVQGEQTDWSEFDGFINTCFK